MRAPRSPICCDLRVGDATLSLISTITVFGTPLDVTLSELAIESFFPADEATRMALEEAEHRFGLSRDCTPICGGGIALRACGALDAEPMLAPDDEDAGADRRWRRRRRVWMVGTSPKAK